VWHLIVVLQKRHGVDAGSRTDPPEVCYKHGCHESTNSVHYDSVHVFHAKSAVVIGRARRARVR
jgi:hypothetical protein